MEELIEALKKVLADTFAFRLKAQYYHWNVEGPNFKEYHALFSELYTAADADIDTIAEHIRALDAYAPGSFGRFSQLTSIQDETTIPAALEMIARIAADNQKLHASLMAAHAIADEQGQRGVVNFLEGLIDANEKTQWMLRSIIKRV
jgi:starvation-inducible DNA-binding protein